MEIHLKKRLVAILLTCLNYNSIWVAISFHFLWNFLVDLMPDKENKIGIYSIKNFEEHSKTIDNIEVFFLGFTLLILLIYTYKRKLKYTK